MNDADQPPSLTQIAEPPLSTALPSAPQHRLKPLRLIEFSILLLILCLAAYLRLAQVAENPGWYSDDIAPDRFAFDPRVTNAKFVAIDNVWRDWAAARIPEVAAAMREVEQWPLAWRAGDIAVYRNPRH